MTTATTEHREQSTPRSREIKPVCPGVFTEFFNSTHNIYTEILANRSTPKALKVEMSDAVLGSIAYGLAPTEPKVAEALIQRYLALLLAIETDVFRDIGKQLFDNRDEFVRGSSMTGFYVKHSVLVSAACADLMMDPDGFAPDSLSAVLLTIRAGCPFSTDCILPDKACGSTDAPKTS